MNVVESTVVSNNDESLEEKNIDLRYDIWLINVLTEFIKNLRKLRKKRRRHNFHFWRGTYLCSVITIYLDVAVANGNRNNIERNNNGMISSIFICYHCTGKLPFNVCIRLKTKQYVFSNSTSSPSKERDKRKIR